MRRGRQAGLTLLQLLLALALIWGIFTLVQSRSPWLTGLFSREVSSARAYFNSVLTGIERTREVDHRTPLPQGCGSFTGLQFDSSSVASCDYQPSASRNFYIVTVISKTGEVFRYAGRGSP